MLYFTTGPKIGISNIEMKCCQVRFPHACNPIETWELIKTTTNNSGPYSSIQYEGKWENGTKFQSLQDLLELRFRTGLWKSPESADAWKIEPYDTFTGVGKNYTQYYKVEEGTMTYVYQLIGSCSNEMSYLRLRSRRLKFRHFSKDGKYICTDYN